MNMKKLYFVGVIVSLINMSTAVVQHNLSGSFGWFAAAFFALSGFVREDDK